jgi:hypothetical protein
MKSKQPEKRKYPPFWEKFIPVFLFLIALVIIFFIVVAIMAALNILPIG